MPPPVKIVAMMNTTTNDSSLPKKNPLRRSPNLPIWSSSDTRPNDSSRSAGDVSPLRWPPTRQDLDGSDMQRLVDELGDTFVPETEVVGDVAAGDSGSEWFVGCVVPDTYDDMASPVAVADLSGRPSVVAEEHRKQEVWEDKMWKMLGRIKAKEERQRVEKHEAQMAVDVKIEHMLARMKAKED